MSTDYEQQIEPLQLARSGRHLNGLLPIVNMARLGRLLCDAAGNAEYDLMFGIDSTGQANITGSVKAELGLYCQRCMDKVLTKVKSNVALGIVSSNTEAELLLDKYEPLVVEDSLLRFGDIIEDELLLALPLIVMHSDEDCAVSKGYSFGDISQEMRDDPAISESRSKKNPFSVLKKLKSN